jgi:hypothetical protein
MEREGERETIKRQREGERGWAEVHLSYWGQRCRCRFKRRENFEFKCHSWGPLRRWRGRGSSPSSRACTSVYSKASSWGGRLSRSDPRALAGSGRERVKPDAPAPAPTPTDDEEGRKEVQAACSVVGGNASGPDSVLAAAAPAPAAPPAASNTDIDDDAVVARGGSFVTTRKRAAVPLVRGCCLRFALLPLPAPPLSAAGSWDTISNSISGADSCSRRRAAAAAAAEVGEGGTARRNTFIAPAGATTTNLFPARSRTASPKSGGASTSGPALFSCMRRSTPRTMSCGKECVRKTSVPAMAS